MNVVEERRNDTHVRHHSSQTCWCAEMVNLKQMICLQNSSLTMFGCAEPWETALRWRTLNQQIERLISLCTRHICPVEASLRVAAPRVQRPVWAVWGI